MANEKYILLGDAILAGKKRYIGRILGELENLGEEFDPSRLADDPEDEKIIGILHYAAKKNKVGIITSLQAFGVNVNTTKTSGWTALARAASAGHVGAVTALLAAGANIESTQSSGFTPLMIAAQDGHVGVIFVLLAAGANVHATRPAGGTVLMSAAVMNRAEVITILVAAGANVDATDTKKGYTALMHASKRNHVEAVEALLAARAKVHITDQEGATALTHALRKNRIEAIATLTEAEADIEVIDPRLRSSLFAERSEQDRAVPQALEELLPTLQSNSLPYYAQVIIVGYDVECEFVGDENILVIGNATDGIRVSEITSKLHGRIGPYTRIDIIGHGFANNNEHIIKLHKIYKTKSQILFQLMRLLSEYPLNIHLWSCNGGAASIDAGEIGAGIVVCHSPDNEDIALTTMHNGVNHAIVAHSKRKLPQVIFAEGIIRGSEGATYSIVKDGKAYHWVFRFSKRFTHADSNTICKVYLQHQMITFNEFLERHSQQPVDIFGLWGDSPIMIAVIYGQLDDIPALVDRGEDIDSPDARGNNPLAFAASYNTVDAVRVLIAAGADLQYVNKAGNTALMIAIINGFADIAELLIDHNATLPAPFWFWHKARPVLYNAVRGNHYRLLVLVLDFGQSPDYEELFSMALQEGHAEAILVILARAKQPMKLIESLTLERREQLKELCKPYPILDAGGHIPQYIEELLKGGVAYDELLVLSNKFQEINLFEVSNFFTFAPIEIATDVPMIDKIIAGVINAFNHHREQWQKVASRLVSREQSTATTEWLVSFTNVLYQRIEKEQVNVDSGQLAVMIEKHLPPPILIAYSCFGNGSTDLVNIPPAIVVKNVMNEILVREVLTEESWQEREIIDTNIQLLAAVNHQGLHAERVEANVGTGRGRSI